jgi:hypothetical protein
LIQIFVRVSSAVMLGVFNNMYEYIISNEKFFDEEIIEEIKKDKVTLNNLLKCLNSVKKSIDKSVFITALCDDECMKLMKEYSIKFISKSKSF